MKKVSIALVTSCEFLILDRVANAARRLKQKPRWILESRPWHPNG
jgi:hypothetical protein